MALKSVALVFALLSILLASISYEASAALGGKVGDWRAIPNPNSTQVVEIAKFAVKEHNSQAKSALEFVKVLSGESQVVSGTNYKLNISATDGGAAAAKKYQAVVWDQPWTKLRKLTSFEEIKG